MSRDVICLAIHGMGNTERSFANDFRDQLSDRLGKDDWARVYFDSIYYQPVLQANQSRVMKAMQKRELDWIRLRKFLLFGFSDAAGLEHRAGTGNSPYKQVQELIRKALQKAMTVAGGPRPVVMFAHSLGCQVVSNYIWDAQSKSPGQGVWKGAKKPATPTAVVRDDFLRFKQLRFFYTTGCNIPIFLAGFPEADIKAVKVSGGGYEIAWKNFYDEDDVLGWPLRPLSKSYGKAVREDRHVNASGSLFGAITQSWNPFSHGGYWTERDVLKPLARDIRSLLP